MLMVTWKHEISILVSELTLQVKNFFVRRNILYLLVAIKKFFSLHKDSEEKKRKIVAPVWVHESGLI